MARSKNSTVFSSMLMLHSPFPVYAVFPFTEALFCPITRFSGLLFRNCLRFSASTFYANSCSFICIIAEPERNSNTRGKIFYPSLIGSSLQPRPVITRPRVPFPQNKNSRLKTGCRVIFCCFGTISEKDHSAEAIRVYTVIFPAPQAKKIIHSAPDGK